MSAPVVAFPERFHVWAFLPDASTRGGGWSLVAPSVTLEQANVYVETFAFPVSVEPAV